MNGGIVTMFLGEANFYRTKGAKDKKKRKEKGGGALSTGAKIGAAGLGGAVTGAGGAWTLGQGLQVGEKFKKFPRMTKLGKKVDSWVPVATVAGLAGGAGIEAIREALKKRREQKRKKYAK